MQVQELTAGHGALTAARVGAGTDIVLLHSLLTDRHAFDAVLPKLAEKHRVTAFNLPGFLGSKPTLVALLDAYVACLEDGFAEFKIGSDAVLIGNGFGGTIALAFAFAHPERIGKLVVCDAAASFPPEGRQAFAEMAEKVTSGGLGAIADIAARRVHSAAYLAGNLSAVEERRKVLLGIDPGAFRAACKILQSVDLVPELYRIGVPTLVVCGDQDQATPPVLAKAVAQKIKGARYVELPGCGHCPPLEQPRAFLAAIKDFAGL